MQPFTLTSVQREALDALSQTRMAGFKGGLVVMATGLGKTWLAAFDATRRSFARFCRRAPRRFCSRHVRYSGRSDRTRRSAW